MKRTYLLITEVIACLFMVLFIYTAISKIMHIGSFDAVLSQSPLIGKYSKIISFAIPTIELLITAMLFFPRTRLKGFYSATILMFAFTLYIGYMLKFTPNLPCQCGGVLRQMTWTQHLYFNSTFVLLGLVAIKLIHKMNKGQNIQANIVTG